MLWLLLAFLLLCSGTVSASETALFGLRRQVLLTFRESSKRSHRMVHQLMQHPRRVLMILLITNTAVNVSIFTVSFFAIAPFHKDLGYWAILADALVPVIVIVCGEMLPKALALASSQRLAPLAAGIVRVLQVALGPLQWTLSRWVVDPMIRLVSPTAPLPDTVSTDELRLLVEHSADDGVISSDENEMLQAIVALEDVGVREVMTPRVDMRSIEVNGSRDDAMEVLRTSKMRRLPVYKHDLDNICGILNTRDLLLHPDKDIGALLHPPHFVPEQVNLMQLLHHFLDEKIHLAIVVDEYGGTSGLVTSENVVEWIVGELPGSEADRSAVTTEKIDENTYRLPGNLSSRLWAERFSVVGVDGRFDTVGGVILSRLGRWPRVGDSIRIQNLTLTVESMQRRRIEYVLLRHDTNQNGPGKSQDREEVRS